jgi:hypothetical protein
VKHALTLKRQRNIVTAQIAETNWGKGLDLETRRAVADWAQAVGIDPATELNVLGGNFYKNAYYYLRRQAELLEAGIIEYAYAEHVELSPDLLEMAKRHDEHGAWAQEELTRRARQRILYNIPAKAESSVVWHVKVRGVPVEFTAAKWCGGGTRKKDPVGDEFPVETSETRAARRTMRLLADWRPSDPRLRAMLRDASDDDQINEDIGGKLREGLLRARQDAERTIENLRGRPIMQLKEGSPYEGVQPAKRPEGQPVAVVEAPAANSDRGPKGERPGEQTAPPADDLNDLDLLSPDERRQYEEDKRARS